MEFFSLNNGRIIPAIGFGTFPMKKIELIKAVWHGAKIGYRYFDTACAYRNEFELGLSLKLLSSSKRKDLFISTKISNRQQELKNVRKAFKRSLFKLGLKQIDMYMVHWPYTEFFLDTWKEMEELYYEGMIKSLGVCNFHVHHLEKLLGHCRVKPVVNQVELHPLLTQKELRDFCNDNDIIVEAYSPTARMDKKLIEHEVLQKIADDHAKNVVQIILRWNYQNKVIPIIKSANPERMNKNLDIFDFELTLDEMSRIEEMNQNYRVRFNPDNCDFSKL